MTNAQQKALATERYPELSPSDARKALRRDLKAEREHNEVIRLSQRYQEQCRKDAEDVARIERDLDMAGIAQTPPSPAATQAESIHGGVGWWLAHWHEGR